MKKLKILFVLENYIPHIGGVEIVFKELGEGLVKLGHEVNIVTHQLKGTKRFEVINGVNVHRIPCFQSRYLFTYLSIPKVLKLAKKADIIHTTTFNGAFPAWVASKLLKKPSIITIHEVWIGKWGKVTEMNFLSCIIHDFLERLIYMLDFDNYVCVSNSTKKQLLGIKKCANKAKVVYDAVDYEFFNPRLYNGSKIRKKLGLKGEFVYMFYGRPGISKGLEFLIKAVPLVAQKIPNSKLLAVVSKDKAYLKRRGYILKLIKELGISNKIILLEPVQRKELPNYIMASNCVVVPSLTEGFGFTAAESCALGKPVVASNTTSLPEVVSGKFVLVEPANPSEIAHGVELVYRNKANSTKKKTFTLKENIKGYLKIYEGLMRK